MTSNSFPIKITHTLTPLPTKLSELEALTKTTLNSTIDQLPQKVGTKTFVNNIEITGNNYITSASKTTYKDNVSVDKVDLTSVNGSNNYITSYKGNDYIFAKGSNNQINAGDGNDTVILSGDNNVKTYLGKGDDLLFVSGNKNLVGDNYVSRINEGNDSVAINGNQNSVYLGTGNDTALITGNNSVIDTGAGNDQVAVSGTKNIVRTYTGDDIVSVAGSQHIVDTDRGNDQVQVKGDSNVINTGTGNDTVFLYGKKNKISTGEGDDQITIDSLTEDNVTYTADGGSIDLGAGNDKATINSIAGTFTINGGTGTNSLKLTNVDLNQYYGTYDKNVLTLFKANGTGDALKINLTNVQTVEFSGSTVYSLQQLTGIQGKTINFNSASGTSKVTNQDGKSNVLQLDFDFGKVISVQQKDTSKFDLTYIDASANTKTLSLDGIYHLKTTEGFTINLTQTPNLKAINTDISSFKTSSARQINSQYTTNIFNPSSSEAYSVNLDTSKDVVLALDNSNPTQLKSYTAKQLVLETYGNSTAVAPGVLDNTILSNVSGKTNVADFSGINTEGIHRIERLRSRANESYDAVTFTANSNFSSLPFSAANKIAVAFDGVTDLSTIVSNYNLANPSNTISHNGIGTEVLAAGTLNLDSANGTYDNIDFTQDSPYYSAIPPALANKIEINFDGVSDTDTIINAYNLANPTNTVSHNGVGTDILAAGTLTLDQSTVLNNQYNVFFNDAGVEKKITLDRYNFIKTAEGHEIHLESALDSLSKSLDVELGKLSPLDTNYNDLKNSQFARGSYNFLSSENDPNKFDALAPLGSATYNLLPTTGPVAPGVNYKSEINTLATALQSTIKFTSKESDYTVDEASKGLYSLRIASILRNRSDILDKLKASGLEVQFSSLQTIKNGNENDDGVATFTQGSNKSYKIQLTGNAFFAGAYNNEDGKAVDIHETLHVLDFLDGTADGSPVSFNAAEKLTFGTARSNLFAPLSLPVPAAPLGADLLYTDGGSAAANITNSQLQGYKNSREFLAYATTAFFERGDELASLGADGLTVYNKLRNYFGLSTNVADPDVNVFTYTPPVL